MEARFGPFGDGVSVGARQVHGLPQTYHRLRNHFGCTDGTIGLEIILIHLETVLVLVQDWCTVCCKHTVAQKSFWMLQMVLLGDEAQVEACFGLFGDSANLDSR